jgi:hypothetical protein
LMRIADIYPVALAFCSGATRQFRDLPLPFLNT